MDVISVNSKPALKKGLSNHKALKHEGIIFGCDQCGFKAKSKYLLAKHKERHRDMAV